MCLDLNVWVAVCQCRIGLVSNWISMSCHLHTVTSGQSVINCLISVLIWSVREKAGKNLPSWILRVLVSFLSPISCLLTQMFCVTDVLRRIKIGNFTTSLTTVLFADCIFFCKPLAPPPPTTTSLSFSLSFHTHMWNSRCLKYSSGC